MNRSYKSSFSRTSNLGKDLQQIYSEQTQKSRPTRVMERSTTDSPESCFAGSKQQQTLTAKTGEGRMAVDEEQRKQK
jgi:hypothetical protein